MLGGRNPLLRSIRSLSPVRRQAIIWTNAGLSSIGHLGTKLSGIVIKINFSFTKRHLKISSAKWRPFCPGGDELIPWLLVIWRPATMVLSWLSVYSICIKYSYHNICCGFDVSRNNIHTPSWGWIFNGHIKSPEKQNTRLTSQLDHKQLQYHNYNTIYNTTYTVDIKFPSFIHHAYILNTSIPYLTHP